MSGYKPSEAVTQAHEAVEEAMREYVRLKYKEESGILVEWVTGYAVIGADGDYHMDYTTSKTASPYGVIGLLDITAANFTEDMNGDEE